MFCKNVLKNFLASYFSWKIEKSLSTYTCIIEFQFDSVLFCDCKYNIILCVSVMILLTNFITSFYDLKDIEVIV